MLMVSPFFIFFLLFFFFFFFFLFFFVFLLPIVWPWPVCFLIRHPNSDTTCVPACVPSCVRICCFAQYKEPVPLMGRSAILGEQRNNYFCDVGCGRGEMGDSTYAITKTGLLCEFNNRRLLDKWVELRVTTACSVHTISLHV